MTVRRFVACAGLLFVWSSISAAPTPANDPDAPTVAEALEVLQKSKAKIDSDANRPGRPIVAVDFRKRTVSADALEVLSALSTVETLSLEYGGREVNAENLRHLERWKSLKHLNLNFCTSVKDAGAAVLAQHTSLVTLELTAAGITEAGLQSLQKLERLEELNLKGAQIVSLERLATLNNLRSLDVSVTPLADDGIAAIGKLTQLRRLNLQGTAVSAVGVRHLAGLTNLEHLNLSTKGPSSEDAAQSILRSVRTATQELSGVDSLPEGSQNGLIVAVLEKHLAGLKNLKNVELTSNTYSRTERLRLGRLWPQATIRTASGTIDPKASSR